MRIVRTSLQSLLLAFVAFHTQAFVQETGGGGNAHWATVPIPFALNANGTFDVTQDQEFDAVRAAFSTWDALANSNLAFSEAASPVPNKVSDSDGTNVVVWIDDVSNPLVQSRGVVAAAAVTFTLATGDILDADIWLDGVHQSWTSSADGNTTSNSGPWDIQGILTHEVGHFIGLDHVTTRSSVMFPTTYPGSAVHTLSQDEISAVQFIYPSATPPAESRISGTVTRSGVGVKRAYVVAYQSGLAIVGGLADASGNYSLRRVPPGSYLVRVQPYSTSPDVVASAFFTQTGNVDVDFLSVIYPNVAQESSATTVPVTAGNNTTGINFSVSASGNQNDPFEQDDTFGTAKVIGVNGLAHLKHSWPGAPLPGPGDLDWVSFSATAGRLYVIQTRNLGPEVAANVTDASSKTVLELYDQTGTNPLAQNTFRNRLESSPGSLIARYETSSATRYVKITQRESDRAGAGSFYDLAVTEVAGAFPPPVVGSVTPAEATEDGSIVVTVVGTNFLPGAQVTFGGPSVVGTEEDIQECVSTSDCRAIKVIVPPHAPQVVAVQVINPDGQIGTLAAGFTYTSRAVGTFTDGTFNAFGDNIGNGTVVCWGDYDRDGDSDLFSPYRSQNGSDTGELWRNNDDATLTDVTAGAGLDTSGTAVRTSCAWGDYDDDGDLDLYVVYTSVGGVNRLYRNNGNGTFSNVAASAGVGGNTSFSKYDAAWSDYDVDGDLDLYLVYATASTTNQLFRNNNNGTFTDVAVSAKVNTAGQIGRALWADYDNDGRADLYVLKRSGQQDILFHNDGNGTFSNVNQPAGIVESTNCFDAAWADFNGDRLSDLLCVSDSLSGSPSQRFWINQGNGTFVDNAAPSGINSLNRSAKAITVLDADNDGDVDAYLGCSGSAPFSLDALLRNNGANPPIFANVAAASGVDESAFPRNANAAAAADFNADGFTDVLTAGTGAGFDDDNYLWRGTSNTNDSITVKLLGTVTNSWGIGAEVTVIPDYPGTDAPTEANCLSANTSSIAKRQEVIGGSLSQASMELEFGLGTRPIETRQVDCLNVYWPRSGLRRAFPRVATNSLVEINEATVGLRVTRITPRSGPIGGGTQVTVIGFNFDSLAQVFFDGIAAPVVSREGSSIIIVTTPANAAGPADVEVRNPGPVSNTLNGGFTYIDPATKITIFLNKDLANNAADLTWNSIGQERYRVRRATGPTPASFSAGFQTVVPRTEYQDTGTLNNGVNYYYLVDEGEP